MVVGPFLSAEAPRHGLTRGQLAGPRVRRVFPGVHLPASVELTLPVVVAAARRLLPPDVAATGVTALRLLDVPAGALRPLRFTTTHPHQVRRPGLLVSRTTALPPVSEGVVTAPWAFVLSASELDLVELVAAGDQLVRSGRTSPDALVRTAATYRGRGARAARRAAGLVRSGVDSPQETELRLCLVLAGLPEPECNPLLGSSGVVRRVDLRYRAWRVVLEYEGDQHRTSLEQWNLDIERHEQLVAEGSTVVRVTGTHLRRPRSVVARVLRALRAAGYTGPDPVLSAEWCRLFSATARASRLAHAFDVLERAVDAQGTASTSVRKASIVAVRSLRDDARRYS